MRAYHGHRRRRSGTLGSVGASGVVLGDATLRTMLQNTGEIETAKRVMLQNTAAIDTAKRTMLQNTAAIETAKRVSASAAPVDVARTSATVGVEDQLGVKQPVMRVSADGATLVPSTGAPGGDDPVRRAVVDAVSTVRRADREAVDNNLTPSVTGPGAAPGALEPGGDTPRVLRTRQPANSGGSSLPFGLAWWEALLIAGGVTAGIYAVTRFVR